MLYSSLRARATCNCKARRCRCIGSKRIRIESDTQQPALTSEYYVDRHAVVNAIAHRSVFNLIHNETIIKFDCIVLKDQQYRQEEFARRRKITIGDFQTWIVTREDLILSKLYWARNSRSELQFRD
jgi:hypothetical protein